MAETCSCILCIATNCNVVVFMTMFVCLYIYIYIYIYIYTHTHTHTHARARVCMYVCVYTHTHTHTIQLCIIVINGFFFHCRQLGQKGPKDRCEMFCRSRSFLFVHSGPGVVVFFVLVVCGVVDVSSYGWLSIMSTP
jgi:hypothetical protein